MAKHTHQYKRITQRPSNRVIYRCMLANCNHYLTEEFILGKQSVCWACQNDFVLDKYAVERTKPKCENCRTKETVFSKRAAQERKQSPFLVDSSLKSKDSLPTAEEHVADILKRYGLYKISDST